MPSILFINRIYPPNEGATGRVLEYVAEGFAQAGWKVSVLVTTTADNLHVGRGGEMRRGVTIYTANCRAFSKHNIFLRAVGYAWMIPSLLFRALAIPRADIVVTMTDPPMLLIAGVLIRGIKKSRLIHWAQDLYPEIAEALGVLPSGGLIAGTLRALSTYSIRAHDVVVVPGRCMKERLIARGISPSGILVIPNTGVEQKIDPLPNVHNAFRKLHGLGEAFVVEYSGNMGLAHDFETVIKAASMLKERGEEQILFLIVGSGPRENSVRGDIREKGLSNMMILPPQTQGNLSDSLGAAELHLVTMREDISGLVVPSKLYGIFAASRPCLFIGPHDSEISLEIRESGAGAVTSPGDAKALVDKILEYRNSPLLCQLSGDRGHSWVRAKNSLILFTNAASALLLDHQGSTNNL